MSETEAAIEINLEKNVTIFEQKTNIKFNDFYNKYFNKVVFYNYKICKDLHVSEDLAQKSIIRALSIIDEYDPSKSKFSTWLYIISKNDTLQFIKKPKRNISLSHNIDEDGTTVLDKLSVDIDNNDVNINEMNFQKGDMLLVNIKKLKEPYKNIMEMREIQHFSYRKISIILAEKKRIIYTINDINKIYDIIDIDLIDPEIKKPDALEKFCEITDITDTDGNKIEYDILKYDKDGLISKIRIYKLNNKIIILGTIPFNMNTLKSKIKAGRVILQKMVKDDFKILEHKYNK